MPRSSSKSARRKKRQKWEKKHPKNSSILPPVYVVDSTPKKPGVSVLSLMGRLGFSLTLFPKPNLEAVRLESVTVLELEEEDKVEEETALTAAEAIPQAVVIVKAVEEEPLPTTLAETQQAVKEARSKWLETTDPEETDRRYYSWKRLREHERTF